MPNERLRDALLRAGLTPAELADRVGVNPKTAERWITQERPPYLRHRRAVATLVQERESYLWPDALPPNRLERINQSEVVRIYSRRSAVPTDLWHRLMEQATATISILVYSGLFLPELFPRLAKTLAQKARDGADVLVLLGDPDSPNVRERGHDEGIGEVMAGKVRSVQRSYEPLRGVKGARVGLHRTTLYNSIYRFDDEMLVNTHAFGFPAAHAPVLHLRRLGSGDMFDFYADSVDRTMSTSLRLWPDEEAAAT
ncbi:DUF5919 domain-containing protein [Virgisporangium ochraceum]|uniref:Transcriptional regulator n=1 Tax=Virgisporangium ochraceum TaxID=65505 RepID=A0A8J3ZZB8_9ACTN|nr:helix-turn-helix transcriptional regulator [Virgisporangium ochraceum]GIJ71265.1 transcriptional regulator [Virgisporangium ochraceum]